MPEGDTLYRTATTLRKALLHRRVTRFDTSVPTVSAVDEQNPVAGRAVDAVEARGKHLLITFSAFGSSPADEHASLAVRPNTAEFGFADGRVGAPNPQSAIRNPQSKLVLHTHLRMTGSWHVYRPGEEWQKPARLARVVIHTDEFVTPCFNAPVVELLTERQVSRHPDLVTLGPDAITPEFDAALAQERLARHAGVEVGVAILDQRALAGVGNIFKSELLFIRRLNPWRKVGDLAPEELGALIEEAHRLLRANRAGGERRTVFGLDQRQALWVYGRSGEPCRVCGTPIRMRRQGVDLRSTYFCPKCQAVVSG